MNFQFEEEKRINEIFKKRYELENWDQTDEMYLTLYKNYAKIFGDKESMEIVHYLEEAKKRKSRPHFEKLKDFDDGPE